MRIAPLSFGLMLALSTPVLADPVIFAAASLKTALDEIATDFTAESGVKPLISYDGSGALAKQILADAPADMFISAATDWMDQVEKADYILPGTREDFLGNTLVLISDKADPVEIADLPEKLGSEHIAMGLLDSVPAGQYGKAALTHLGLWEKIEPQVAQAQNVRAALALVASGEAPYGIVYKTDAAAEPKVHVVATFPEGSYPAITYPIALLKAGPDAEGAKAFYDYLTTPKATALLEQQGFEILKK
ncbi:molybdate ABC transporter substrate-binding protein [Sinirhodobacter populi]|uniref:Molybdate ABC transporter substrate-binding protein n=1 Tax=Paenirhodobacter populi TaxID=2306993 RepID=A0A443KL06_9RHOB|nr:molybdate ABC transporter substrate-binding protein [Sinirhodobacter populi]RWR33426.1 molybdate ABC transporter substrate-binding protein [Sinirhodobacter populi]